MIGRGEQGESKAWGVEGRGSNTTANKTEAYNTLTIAVFPNPVPAGTETALMHTPHVFNFQSHV